MADVGCRMADVKGEDGVCEFPATLLERGGA